VLFVGDEIHVLVGLGGVPGAVQPLREALVSRNVVNIEVETQNLAVSVEADVEDGVAFVDGECLGVVAVLRKGVLSRSAEVQIDNNDVPSGIYSRTSHAHIQFSGSEAQRGAYHLGVGDIDRNSASSSPSSGVEQGGGGEVPGVHGARVGVGDD